MESMTSEIGNETPEGTSAVTPQEAWERMREGNQRFIGQQADLSLIHI